MGTWLEVDFVLTELFFSPYRNIFPYAQWRHSTQERSCLTRKKMKIYFRATEWTQRCWERNRIAQQKIIPNREGQDNGKLFIFTYVPNSSLRIYLSSMDNCLSGSLRSRFDFFVESFFPNSGILFDFWTSLCVTVARETLLDVYYGCGWCWCCCFYRCFHFQRWIVLASAPSSGLSTFLLHWARVRRRDTTPKSTDTFQQKTHSTNPVFLFDFYFDSTLRRIVNRISYTQQTTILYRVNLVFPFSSFDARIFKNTFILSFSMAVLLVFPPTMVSLFAVRPSQLRFRININKNMLLFLRESD